MKSSRAAVVVGVALLVGLLAVGPTGVAQQSETPGIDSLMTQVLPQVGGENLLPDKTPVTTQKVNPFGGNETGVEAPGIAIVEFGAAWVDVSQLSGDALAETFAPGGTFACGARDDVEVICSEDDDASGDAYLDGFDLFGFGTDDTLLNGLGSQTEAALICDDGINTTFDPSVENDAFRDGNDIIVARSFDGAFDPLQRVVFDGSFFPPAPTQARLALNDSGGGAFAIPGMLQCEKVRIYTFRTDIAQPFQPDTVIAYAYPGIQEMLTTSEIRPIVVAQPAEDLTAPTLTKEFTDDPVEAGGTVTLEFTLTNTTTAEATSIAFFDDLSSGLPGATTVEGGITDPCGAGSAVSGGSRIELVNGSLPPEASCTFGFNVLIPGAADPGVLENSTSPVEAIVGGGLLLGDGASDTLTVIAASGTSSTTESTTAASTAAPTTAPATTTGATDDGGSSTGPFIVLILVGIVAIAVALWWWRTFGIAPPWMWPCWPLYQAWQKAKRACEKALTEAKAKRKVAKDAAEAQKKADKKLKDHCKKYPPACGKPASVTDVASGRTIDRDDLWVQSQWTADAWSKYGAKTQTAAETEAQWKSPPDAAFDKKKRAELAKAKGETAGLEAAAKKAKADAEQAEAAAAKAETAAKKACDDADKAKAAYDACIGKAAPAPAPGAGPGGGPGPGPGGAPPGGAGGAGPNCEPQRKAYETAQKECDTATKKAEGAEAELEEAEEAVENADEAMEDYCEQYPPNCRDDSVSSGGETIRTEDVYLNQVWAEQVMVDFSTGQIDGNRAEQLLKDGPTEEFKADELQKLKDAKALKPGLEKDITDAKAKVPAKKKAAEEAKAAADAACQKAIAAKKAFEACAGPQK